MSIERVMMKTVPLPKWSAPRAGNAFQVRSLVLSLLLLSSWGTRAEQARGALDTQRQTLSQAVTRGDAAAAAGMFTVDAKLLLPGFDMVNSVVAQAASTSSGQAASTISGQGPQVDQVGFPKDYRSTFKVIGIPVRTNISPALVLTAYGNDLAASVTNAAQLPYPDGSIIAMEFAKAIMDSEGKPMLDANGQPRKGEVEHIDVMRRGQGFGEAYGSNRSGQWEFAGYHLDGTYSTPPAKSASCAQCHQKAGAAKDFVFPLKNGFGMTP